jgi:hypothetical protein
MASGDIVIRTTDGMGGAGLVQDSSNSIAQFQFAALNPNVSAPGADWTGQVQITLPVVPSNNLVSFLQFWLTGTDVPSGLFSGTYDLAIIEH